MPPLDDDGFDRLLHERLGQADEDELQNEDPGLDEDDAAEMTLMHKAIGNYKVETLAFAERQSAAMPVPRVGKVVALWDSTPRWALAATTMLLLGFTTMFVTHHSTEPAAHIFASAPTAQALADDNRLLLSVNEALTTSTVAPSEEELGLIAAPAHGMKQVRATN